MSDFVLTALRGDPEGLRGTVPIRGRTVAIRSAADGSADLYSAVLSSPLRYRGADIHQVILRPAVAGQTPHFGMRGFAVQIAPIIDPSMRTASVLDPALLDFATAGLIDDASPAVRQAPVAPERDDHTAVPPGRRPTPPPRRAVGRWRSRRTLWGVLSALSLAAGVVWGWPHFSAGPPAQTPSGQIAAPASGSSASSAPAMIAPLEQPAVVLRLLPPGYAAGACTADTAVPAGVRAALSCGPNTDRGGPARGHYLLFADQAGLKAGLDRVIAESTQQQCPGRIMSPGAWRHNATPQTTAGTLYCGVRSGKPVIAWTDGAKSLLSVVDSDGQPDMGDMFSWWSTHS